MNKFCDFGTDVTVLPRALCAIPGRHAFLLWLYPVTKVDPSLNQPTRREKETIKGGEIEKEPAVLQRQSNKEKKDWQRGEREKKPAVLQRQPNKEKKGWQGAESETGLGEQLKQQKKGKSVRRDRLNAKSAEKRERQRMRGRLGAESAEERERPGYETD